MENVPTEGNDGKTEEKKDVSVFDKFPEELLLKIFHNLKFDEQCRAQRVCKRWNELFKTELEWKSVDVHHIKLTTERIEKLFNTLPNITKHLRIYRFPINSVPDFNVNEGDDQWSFQMGETPFPARRDRFPSTEEIIPLDVLQNRCPYLETLILESVVLNKSYAEQEIGVWSLPMDLEVLSVRGSQISPLHFGENEDIPQENNLKIKILDFTKCKHFSNYSRYFFGTLSFLQELYLAGCFVGDFTLSAITYYLPGLKVLDIENSAVHGRSFLFLNEQCNLLEQLFISSQHLTYEEFSMVEQGFFPNLKILCLKGTRTSCESRRSLLSKLPNVEFVNGVSRSDVLSVDYQDDYKDEICDHFLLRKDSFQI